MSDLKSVLTAEGICLKLSGNEILKDVSLEMYENRIYGLVGLNGAGKTSLLKVILGLLPDYKGKVRFINAEGTAERRSRVGAVLDSIEPDSRYHAEAYLHRVADMLGIPPGERKTESLLDKVGLKTGKKKIGQFSLGMKRRLMIACALLGEPKILILDEPFNGIDPEGMNDLRILFRSLVAEGVSVLITSHIINELIKISDDFGVICEGRMVTQISGEKLKEQSGSKLVIQTMDPRKVIELITGKNAQAFCISTGTDEVSVIGTMEVQAIRDRLSEEGIRDAQITETKMESEDWLLWKMNGYG